MSLTTDLDDSVRGMRRRRGVSPRGDGKLRCGLCRQRVASQLMVIHSYARGDKRHYYCPSCEQRSVAFAQWKAMPPAPPRPCVSCGKVRPKDRYLRGQCDPCYKRQFRKARTTVRSDDVHKALQCLLLHYSAWEIRRALEQVLKVAA